MTHKIPTNRSCPTVAALFGIMLLFSSSSVPAAIVSNGGFETNVTGTIPWATSDLDTWTVGRVLGTPPLENQNRVDGLDTTVLYALAPHSGDIAAAFDSNTNTVTDGGVATLTQPLTTVPALTYDLTFWLANPIQDDSVFTNVFSVTWNGTLITLAGPNLTETSPGSKTYQVTPNTSWFQVTATNLAATGTSTNLMFSGRNSDWGTLLDDVSVAETPEPATLMMLGAAMILMGLRRARRSRVA